MYKRAGNIEEGGDGDDGDDEVVRVPVQESIDY